MILSPHSGTWERSGEEDSLGWGQLCDSHPHLLRWGGGAGFLGILGSLSWEGVYGGRLQLPRLVGWSCFHYAEPAVKVKATSDESPQGNYTCFFSAQPVVPLRTAWAAFCRHLVCLWASPGQWAPCQQRALGRRHRDRNRREGRMRQQMLFQGLCVREAAIHPRILISNKKEVHGQGDRPRWLHALCPLSST